MAAPLIQLKDIHLTFGGAALLEGAELSIGQGERLALVGRNGSGKSTLLKIAARLISPDRGERMASPSATIRYLPQEPDLSAYPTTLTFVESGLTPGDVSHRAQYLLEQLGLSGSESTHELSGGEARRAALARALAPNPDVLLLDEPTNHLDLPAIEWLEAELSASRSAFVIVSHDRRFLQTLTQSTVWLDRGRTRTLNQGFGAFEEWRDQVLEEEARDRHKLDRRIVMEEDWVRYGVTARRKRNQGRMERLQGLRQQRRDARRAQGQVQFGATQADPSGALVIEAKSISKSYGERAIVKNFSTRIMRRDRVAVIGPNGAGKSTLLNLLIGRLAPESGEIRLGANLSVATLDQDRSALNPDMAVAEFLTDGRGDAMTVNGQTRHVSSYMKDFLFQPEQARTPVRVLSGGERGRLMLAKILAAPSNLLVLDEPTNDLDLETLDLLQEMLADYPGTVLLVSHDRDFIDHVATVTLMAEGDGRFTEYAGGYSDMVAQRGAGTADLKPSKSLREKASRDRPPTEQQGLRRKLTFKDKHALETLPARIDALHAEIAKLHHKLADTNLFTTNRVEFDRASQRLTAAQSELALAENQWLELEALREEIGG
jgi:ATP-binding cassette subfamily F protein uup